MKRISVIAMLACLLVAAVTACKKSTPTSVQQNYLTGKWRKTRVATDSNNNGRIDDLELSQVTSYDSTHVFVFNIDGSGTILTGTTQVGTFNWQLENSNTYLKVDYYPGTGLTNIYEHLDTLAKEAFTLRDTTGSMVRWSMYTKQ